MNLKNKIRFAVISIGFLLIMGTSMRYGLDLFAAAVALWALTPYILFGLLTAKFRKFGVIVGAGFLLLSIDMYTRIIIIFFPSSSTSSLAFLFLPFWLSILILPIGAILGALVEWIIHGVSHR